MFWKAFGLALLTMIALVGIAGTATLSVLYASKSEGLSPADVDATVAANLTTTNATASDAATAAYSAGRQAGAAEAEKCDVIVGAAGNFSSFLNSAGDTVSKTLTIRSNKTGSTYTVQGPAVCVVSEDKQHCEDNQSGFAIGDPWPRSCH